MSVADRFGALHEDGLFIMPNAWDVGSARLLERLGFPAIATTSSGHAGSLGRADQQVTRDELLGHVEAVVAGTGVPVSIDSEACYPEEPGGIARTVELIAATGAAGCSIEDYVPGVGLLPVEVAADRVHEAATVATRHGLVLTARAENHLYGAADLDDTITRLVAYREAGAHVLYAPGPADLGDIRRLVAEVAAPVNVLAVPGIPPISELARAGVRRVSTGGALAWVAYRALITAALELRDDGTTNYLATALSAADRDAAFRDAAPGRSATG